MRNALAMGLPGWIAGLKLIMLGVMSFWLYQRVTKQEVFVMLAAAFGLNGILALIFLSGPNVLGGIFGVLINALAFSAILLVLNGIVCSKLIHEVPKFHLLERELMVDPDKGLQLVFTSLTAFMIIMVTHLIAPGAYKLIETKTGLGLDMAAYVIYILMAAGIGYLTMFYGEYVVPWNESRDTFVTGDIKLDSIDVFEVKETVSLPEKIGVPMGFYVFFCLIPYFLKDVKEDMDKLGLGMIFIVIASISYLEFFHKQKKKNDNAIEIK